MSCDPADRAMKKAKEYCTQRGGPYWSVRDLDGLDVSELSAHVFYCDRAQRDDPLSIGATACRKIWRGKALRTTT